MTTEPHVDRGGVGDCGLLAVALGAWVALTPFVATPEAAWEWRFDATMLAVLPGAAAALGGLGLVAGRQRSVRAGALLALAGGLWLVLWPVASVFSTAGPLGDPGLPMLQWSLFYVGSGAVLTGLAAYGLGWLDAIPARDEPLDDTRSARPCVAAAADTPRRARRAVRRPPAQRPRPGHGAGFHAGPRD
jgi:peptidoglycan/LPS O-acetylase OafA/YrhL